MIPKPGKLKEYKRPTAILYRCNPNDFVEMDSLLWCYLDLLTETINQLWPTFFSWMRAPSSSEEPPSKLGGIQRELK
jgi:hypothetical protein